MSSAWTVVKRLGAGGTAELFVVRDGSGRVAIEKRLFLHFAREPAAAALFEHEGRLLEALSVRGVPRLFARDRVDERPCLRMELIAARPLGALVRDHGAAPAPVVCAIVHALLTVLDAVHTARDPASLAPLSIVHRDVSPSNVLLGHDATLSLIDFGIAQSAWAPDVAPERATPGYTAPEVYERAPAIDARADLFAVGVMAIELGAGARLFAGGSLAAMGATFDEAYRSSQLDRVDPSLRAWASRALALDRDARFATARSMREALAQCGPLATRAQVQAWAAAPSTRT